MDIKHNPQRAGVSVNIDWGFLEKIIPDDGAYAVFWANHQTKKRGQVLCADLDEMVSTLIDRCPRGCDAYHACASFKTDESRAADNAKSMKALFLDLDCGVDKARDGKGYATTKGAVAALRAFCTDLGLPRPMLINSGGGIHAYWPFTIAVPISAWKPVAERLKTLCKARGLLADAAVTADAARVLRPVGSVNFKYDPPQVVRMIRDAQPHCFSILQDIINAGPDPQVPYRARPARRLPHTKAVMPLQERVNPNGYNLSDVETALRLLDPDCDRHDWASVGMAIADAFGEEGRDIFDRWSRGDLEEDA